MPNRVVIAGGTGRRGRALALALKDEYEVRVLTTSAATSPGAWQCDLTSIAEAEVALAGAHTVVFLAWARGQPARLFQGELSDVDALMADSVSRAAQRVGAKHVIFYACGDNDPREAILRASGISVSVLRGNGPEVDAALVKLVSQPASQTRVGSDSVGTEARNVPPSTAPRVWSVQRFERPANASAEALARAYFEWLPSASPLTRVEHIERTWRVMALGVPVLMLQHSPGRSEPDCYVLEVVGGALASCARGRFEFRVLRDGSVAVALIDFAPALPWPVYRVTQAMAHARVMRAFGKALESKTVVPA